jgi:hypothetical protein
VHTTYNSPYTDHDLPSSLGGIVKMSPQERLRRRELALKLHREGKLGQRQQARMGGYAKARRTSELAQRLVEENRSAIEKTLRDILRSGTPGQKLRASEALLKIGLAAERLDVSEHKSEAEHLDRAQLIATLAQKLTSSPSGHLLAAHLAEQHGQVIEGSAVELPPGP